MNEFITDPHYVQGQIEALRAMILGIANLTLSPEEFRNQSLERLETLRTAMLAEPVPDSRLRAVDDAETWIRKVTETHGS